MARLKDELFRHLAITDNQYMAIARSTEFLNEPYNFICDPKSFT